jgi:uncharacterized protein
MKILVMGATGKLGSRIVRRACSEGHKVITLVRNTSNLQVLNDLPITILKGDVLDSTSLENAMLDNIEVVISVIGSDKNIDYVIENGMRNIISTMQKHQINKLIAIGGAGILRNEEHGLLLYTPHFPSFLKPMAEQHLNAWEIVADSSINYTYICPPRMVDGSFSDEYITQEDFPIEEMAGKVSYESCADYIVHILDTKLFKNKRISINHKNK